MTDGHSCTCITCGDEATRMRAVRIDRARALSLCEEPGGRRSTVDVTLLTDVMPGDIVLVHAGVAIARLGAGEPAR